MAAPSSSQDPKQIQTLVQVSKPNDSGCRYARGALKGSKGPQARRAPIRFAAFSACSMRHGNSLGFDFRRPVINRNLFIEVKISGGNTGDKPRSRLNVKSWIAHWMKTKSRFWNVTIYIR